MNTSDKFSLRRFRLSAGFYWPAIRRQAALYAGVSLLLGVLTVCVAGNVLMLAFAAHILLLMLWLGPLAIASRSAMTMEVALPATGGEKSACLMVYSFVIMPLFALAPFTLCVTATYGYLAGANPDIVLFLKMVRVYLAAFAPYHLLACGILISVCLLAVSAFRRRRVLRSVLAVLATYVLLCLISAAGFMWSLKQLYIQGFIGHESYSITDETQIFADAARFIPAHSDCIGSASAFGIAENVLLGLALAAVLVAIYRTIRTRQV